MTTYQFDEDDIPVTESPDGFSIFGNSCGDVANGVAIGDGLYKVIETFSWLSSLEENCYHFEELVTNILYILCKGC